jgi:hypothetical protein
MVVTNRSVAMTALLVRYGVTPSQEKKVHLPASKPSCRSPLSSIPLSKFTGGESKGSRNVYSGFLEATAFPVLCGRMVNFEDTQDILGVRVPICEGIETRAEDNILANAPTDGTMELILGIPAACCQGSPKHTQKRSLFHPLRARLLGRPVRNTQNAKREGVVEHLGIIQDLVRGAAQRNPQRGFTWAIYYQ